MASLTVENYVKAIFKICRQDGNQLATTGRLAIALEVSPGTVTSMLKALSDASLATYTPYEGVQLTESGLSLALEILRRHRLIESFLAEVLDMSWDEVHDDAEQLEHSVSNRLIDRIDQYLRHPEFDPHGDPIPRSDGTLPERASRPLADAPPEESFTLVQVIDQTPEFLRHLSSAGFVLGCRGIVKSNRPEAGVITVTVGDTEVSLGIEAARKMLVTESARDDSGNLSEPGGNSTTSVPAPHLETMSVHVPR